MGAAKVLLIAEGPSEFGELDQSSWIDPRRARVEGYFPPMLRRLLGTEVTIEAKRVMSLGRFEQKPKLKGHADKAAKALALANAFGSDVVVFVKDVDRQPGVKKTDRERAKKLASIHSEIEIGFAAVAATANVERIKATPCRMLESWALGDAQSIATVGGAHARIDLVPTAPENVWGDEADPSSKHPKCLLRRALGQEPTAERFAELAAHADIESVRRTCPESFEPFFLEAAAAAAALTTIKPQARSKRPRR